MGKIPAESLAKYLRNIGVVKNTRIYDAFFNISREDFLPQNVRLLANADNALSIGFGQTNSQPYTVAFMLHLLKVKKEQKVLDVGSGSGWSTALLAHMVGPKGSALGVEIIPELVTFGNHNLNKYRLPWAHIYKADDDIGLVKNAPYDRILVSASAKEIPQGLIDQLDTAGIMVIPVKESIWQVTKTSAGIQKQEYPGFLFVPLV